MNRDRLKEIISILNKNNILKDRSPSNIRKTIEELGPTFIKIGQILSTRVDLLPVEYINELSKLRSEVKAISFDSILSVLKEEYKNIDYIFKGIDKVPLGTASIAQVHKAILNDGRVVALKIKKPNIEKDIIEDMNLMKEAIKILHLNSFIKIIDLSLVLDELYSSMLKELDFKLEADNINKYLENNYYINNVGAPLVIKELSSDKVLVMEYIDGISINKVNKLKEFGYDTSTIALNLSDNFIKQALEDGLFHADLHPDNIFISNNKIIFLDWGMVGTLSDNYKELLNKCSESIVRSDYSEVSNILITMCKSSKDVDKNKLEKDIENILSTYSNLGLDNIDITSFIKDMFKMLQSNNLILDNDLTMLARGICVVESVIKKLDSSISLMDVLERKVFNNKVNNFSVSDTVKKVTKKLDKSCRSMSNIPIELDSLIKKVNDDNFKFKFELSDSKKQVNKLESLVHEIVLGFIDGCLIVGLCLIDSVELQSVFLVFVILISIILGIHMILDIIHNGY